MSEAKIRTRNILNKIETIKALVYTKVIPLEDIRYQVGELTGAEQPQYDDNDWQKFTVGQSWGGRDVFCWFRIPLKIPEAMPAGKPAVIIQPGKRFFFHGCEGGDLREYELMVYLDGVPLQSVDVRRNEIPLWDKVTPGSEHLLAIEAFSGLESQQHQFLQADLVVVTEPVEDFYYNIKIVYETMQVIGDNHSDYHRLFRILEQALLHVDFLQMGQPGFLDTIKIAHNYLCNKLYGQLPRGRRYATVICSGHAHIDIAWKWQTRHSQKKAARTFANALRLMALYSEFHFTQSQAQLYRYVQVQYPEIFAQIKHRIDSGQWEVTGGMWVEADCNIPGGESLVRQFLFGQRYFNKEFGVDTQVVWLPDGFGFCYSLPQIIKKCGMRYFMTTKLSWNQFVKFPYDTFYWQGLDGTRILAHFITTPDPRGWNDYSGDLNPATVKGCWDNYRQKGQNRELLLASGWGDGGGGPTRDMQENAKRLNYFGALPSHRQGSVEQFFAELEQRVRQLPVWNDELYLQLHRGCYTSQARIKKNNRTSEILYHNAELFATINYLATGRYPHDELNTGWELILLNQFHDILPGSSIAKVYQDSEKEFNQVKAIGTTCLDRALAEICCRITTPGVRNKLVLFNSLSWPRTDLVRIALPELLKNFRIVDNDGNALPGQVIGNQDEMLLPATAIPAMGYRMFNIEETESPSTVPTSLIVTTRRLQNRFFDIKLDANGLITSILDRRCNREIIAPGKKANLFQLFEDRPVANDAWDLDIFYQDKHLDLVELEEARVVETGPIRGGLCLQRKFFQSTITQAIYIYDQIPRIDFCTEINWQQHQTLLKVAFPVAIHANTATFEIPYGNIERPTHWNTDWDRGRFEVPAQKWADLSEGDYGVSLLNDCKYGYDIKDNVMRLTLIKSAVNPDPNADMGHHSFCYSLYPHQGNWRSGNTVRTAYEFNFPVIHRIIQTGSDDISPEFSLVKINQDNVIIESVKKAEDDAGIILRLYEVFNQRGAIRLEFAWPLEQVSECNMLEEVVKSIDFSKNICEVYVGPYEITTLKIIKAR